MILEKSGFLSVAVIGGYHLPHSVSLNHSWIHLQWLLFSITVRKLITGDKFRNDLKRQNGAGDIRLWQQQKETQTSPKSFPLKQIFPNHITKGEFLTNPWTCPWLISSIHSHLPVYMAGVSSLFTSQGFFICSRKVTTSGLETTRPAIRKRNVCFARDSSVYNLICIQARRGGTCAKSLQSCLTLCHPMDCSQPGSSVYGILQARILGLMPPAFNCLGTCFMLLLCGFYL